MGSLVEIISGSTKICFESRSYNESRMKVVGQFDKSGNLIAVFPSIAEAERTTKIRHIYECVNYKRKSAGGYIWRVLQGDNYEYCNEYGNS